MSIAFPESIEQRLLDLGSIPLSRVLMQPAPGLATLDDWSEIRHREKRLVELVDATLVEKPMGWLESLVASVLIQLLRNHVDRVKLGVVTGPDGFIELFEGLVRSPDIAFIKWERLPDGGLPNTHVPQLVPNFVIEVLSVSNTYSEMSRKRREYFQAGVELVWMVDHRNRTITVYKTSESFEVIREGERIDASPVLPGWSFSLSELFSKLDEINPNSSTRE
jgi:Uma2 family endonuclease